MKGGPELRREGRTKHGRNRPHENGLDDHHCRHLRWTLGRESRTPDPVGPLSAGPAPDPVTRLPAAVVAVVTDSPDSERCEADSGQLVGVHDFSTTCFGQQTRTVLNIFS